MSKRADPDDWTTCPCHNAPIKRANLPFHLKKVKRSDRKQKDDLIKKKAWYLRMIDRFRSHTNVQKVKEFEDYAEEIDI